MKPENQKRCSQHGGVIIEAGLAVPFLAFTLLMLADAVQISRNYMALTLIARETVISAATLDGLENHLIVPTVAPSDTEIRECYDALMVNYQPPAGRERVCAIRLLSQRIVGLSKSYSISMAGDGLSVEVTKNPANRLLKAEVRCVLSHLSGMISGITVRTSATGSYDA